MKTRIIILCLISVLPLGCATHRPLTRKSTGQALSVSQIHQQQVLDNLAMFVSDANAWPFFSRPEGGKSSVSDTRKGSLSVGWIRSGFSAAGLSGDASRTLSGDWTLLPINDPHKLTLMRCAYQNAVEGSSYNQKNEDKCINCDKRREVFNSGHSAHDAICKDCFKKCWFRIGTKDCVPKHCTLVGRYCDTYVWVEPGKGQNELSKLTMQILEYAIYEPVKKSSQMKEVTEYRNAKFKLTTKELAVYTQTYKAKFNQLPIEDSDPKIDPENKSQPSELFPGNNSIEYELRRSTNTPSRFLEQRIRQDIYGN